MKPWQPSAWEAQCLNQMDDDRVWASMNRSKPDPSAPLPGWVWRMIFFYNLAIFAAVIGAIFAAGLAASGASMADALDPLTLGVGGGVTVGLAFFAASIYRRSWNRRAASFASDPGL